MSEPLTSLSCYEFAEQLASRAPVPGGGGAAALIGSLAAALGSMATTLTLGKKKFLSYEEDHERIISETEFLRGRFLELVEEDAAAFEPLSRVYSSDRNTAGYDEEFRNAVLNACRAPLEIMERCCMVIVLLEELLPKCSLLLLSDVGCAALAAGCALESASMNVFVNTRMLPDFADTIAMATRADAMLSNYVHRARSISDSVMAHLRGIT